MPPLFPVLASWIQPGTLSLVAVVLLWQQVRFLGQRLDEFGKRMDEFGKRMDEFKQETNAKLEESKRETNTKLDEYKKDTNAKLDEFKRETSARLDRTDAKLDRIIDILVIQALQAGKASSTEGLAAAGELTERQVQAS